MASFHQGNQPTIHQKSSMGPNPNGSRTVHSKLRDRAILLDVLRFFFGVRDDVNWVRPLVIQIVKSQQPGRQTRSVLPSQDAKDESYGHILSKSSGNSSPTEATSQGATKGAA